MEQFTATIQAAAALPLPTRLERESSGLRKSQPAGNVEASDHAEHPASAPAWSHSPPDPAALCRVLALASDRTRLKILWMLSAGEQSVGRITTTLGVPQPTVSHHLGWLRAANLVFPRRKGKNIFYTLGDAARAEVDGSLSLITDDAVIRVSRRGGS